ncbi:PREDICTED: uncharacterized protein LOC105456026 [Wasmannia auropunctata]|uniref:uncharacterized protein LOC105456026 n=1 Tax=Wasmannia auropunctata TaxID=64793 RepID=UPI0005EEF65D|nr:PREDICTED: uncharacterized protein LOC105456026 [Wasmannia auropunctata]
MKHISVLFAVLAIVGLGQAHQFPDFGSGPLHEDVQDFLDLVPTKEINKIALDYMSEDSEVQAALNYLLTTTVLKDLMVDLEAIPEVINLMNYIQKGGVDIYLLVNEVNKALGIDKLVPPSHSYSEIIQRTGGLAGLFKDIKKVIPFNKFIRTYVQKMKTSSAFVGLIDQLKSNNFQQVVNKIYQIKSFQIIVNGLKTRGVNTQIVADVMYIVLGITVPNDVSVQDRTLNEELMDFLQLLPIEQIVDIMTKYVEEDEKVQNALQYLFSSDFQSMAREAEALKEYQALITYLKKAGLDIDVVRTLYEVIGMKNYVPLKIETIFESQIGMQKIGDGMKGMIKDIYDIIPFDKIDALYKEKLQTSKVFPDFIKAITSPEMQKIIDDLYANQTFKNFVMTAREHGLEFEEMTKLLTRIFGLKFPYITVLNITVPNDVSVQDRTLNEELIDFLQILPIEQIADIVTKYVEEDEKVQNALQYLLSSEFESMAREVEALKEYQALITYLKKAGLNADDVKALHEVIGMEDYVSPKTESIFESQIGIQKIGDGIKGMIKDIYNILPLDKIDALYQKKLQNSKVFADFIKALTAPEMQKIIDDLYANQTYKNFVITARAHGLEFEEMMKLATRMFGIKFPYLLEFRVYVNLVDEFPEIRGLQLRDKILEHFEILHLGFVERDKLILNGMNDGSDVIDVFANRISTSDLFIIDIDDLRESEPVVQQLVLQLVNVNTGVVKMKFISVLFAVLAIVGLGQAHPFPDFGSGPLHEDVQDFLDLVPSQEISNIVTDYVSNDPEVQAAVSYLLTLTVLKDLVVGLEAIPEVINVINYVQKQGVDAYLLVNAINKALGIDELVPPSSHFRPVIHRTGGLAGLFRDIKKVVPLDKFIHTYAQKIKTSSAFVGLIDQLKSNNFQQAVNKAYQIESFQTIENGLKSSGVNTQIAADIMYIVLGITTPNNDFVYQERTLEEELMDFVQLLPMENIVEVIISYVEQDEKVLNALEYMFSPEFESMAREVEALKEYQAIVAYLEKNIDASVYQERTLEEEMMDFVQLLPIEQIINIAIKYAEEDEKVQNALQYLFSSEFESITREVEALKEYQAIVAYMEKNVLNVINSVKTIGMQAYVPHKIKGKSQIGIQKIGDGMIGMIKDLNNLLPTDKIDALFKEKMQNSKVFADFIEKLISPEMQKLAGDLLANQTYQNFINTAIENGLELVELGKLIIRVIGLKI